ncbi:flagellar basal body L-ring protein FlgH [Rubrivirga sp.]|uniref:flagellar basal body L-ring protein FlgH n=1 Tax=Rubrivirga sp. TaxID=1885344 RepID=UPI003B52E241
MIRTLLLLLVAGPAAAQAPAPPPEPAPRQPLSLYSSLRAYQAGDLLTVVLAERTSARRASESSAESSAQVGGAGSSSLGGFFGLDATAGGRRDADSRTVQSDLLAGTITARVVAVDPAGNLSIEGERRLNVDGDVHLMTVRGLVRPADVTTANTVLSYQIAGADVVYRQEGGGPKFLRGRFLTLVGTVAVVVGAVLLTSSAGGGADALAP